MPFISEEAHYRKMQEKLGARKGDKVFIFRTATDFESGWQNSWPPDMDMAVNHYGIVESDHNTECGIRIMVPEVGCSVCYPYFVLRIIR